MNRKEIESILNYEEVENGKIFIPNEIFNDFRVIEGTSSNRSFCFSFYYLVMYLYRFVKYDAKYYSVSDIKSILGYSRTNKTLNNLIKKNGVLDKMGYLTHTTNYPISWRLDEYENIPVFVYYNDTVDSETDDKDEREYEDHDIHISRRNKSISVPIKGLYRTPISMTTHEQDGVFFYIENTTRITVDTFIFCMSKKELGVEGFWTYSFIKHMNDYYGGAWNIPQSKMVEELGIKPVKLNQVLSSLESYNMITNSHEKFVIGLPKHIKLKACAYYALSSKHFVSTPKDVGKRTVMSFKTWSEIPENAEILSETK